MSPEYLVIPVPAVASQNKRIPGDGFDEPEAARAKMHQDEQQHRHLHTPEAQGTKR